MSTENNTKEKLAIGGALVGGLMFFGFLTQTPVGGLSEKNKAIGSYGFNHGSKTPKTPKTLKTPLELPEATQEVTRTATFQKDKFNALNAKYKKLESKFKDDRYEASQEIGKIKKEHEKSLRDLAEKNEQLAYLKKKHNELKALSKKDGAMNSNEIAKLKADNKEMKAAVSGIQSKLKNTFGITSIDGLIEHVGGLQNQNKKLKASLADEKFILERQNQSLKAQVNQFRAAKNVFVQSADLLPKKAQALLTDLKALEGKKPEEVEKAYQDIATKHGAVSKLNISFASGSSEMTPKIIAAIKAAATKADSKAYFFVVGYADKTGDAASNQKLSSARATVTAKELAKSSKGFQAAQAYYLGQTDRFGPNEKNRIVEIWVLK